MSQACILDFGNTRVKWARFVDGEFAGVQQDEEARRLCIEADQYFFGRGVGIDLPRSCRMYRAAAALDSVTAMNCLGSA